MKKIVFLLSTLFCFSVKADFQIGPGINLFLPIKSNETNFQNLPYLKTNTGLGLELNMQFNLPLAFSINLNGGYDFGVAKSQYSYTDTSATATVSDLNTNYTVYTGAASLRFHVIRFDHFNIFGGYGITVGSLVLDYLTNNFLEKHGSLSGFHQTESHSFTNDFWEAGSEIYWNKKNILQLVAKIYKIETGRFSTLNSSPISASTGQVTLLYSRVFN